MRIGLAVPVQFSFDGPGNGVRVQAIAQADALQALGHDVVRLDPWQPWDGRPFDVVQVFSGGLPFFNAQFLARRVTRKLVLAPMIDSNQPNWLYRLAAEAGRRGRRFHSTAGELQRLALAADLVVVRSTHEQDRIVQGLGVPRQRTAVVLNGVTPPPPADPRRAWELLGFDTPFVLHVSSYCDPRKNVIRLIEAVGPTGLPLVIAGASQPGAVLEKIQALQVRYPNVRRLDFVPPDLLAALYAACRVLALPSLHEGTGLVALEAAAHGAAVVVTGRGGTRDYFLDLARYADPYDTDSIRTAVAAAMADAPSGLLRERVRSQLTWAASARQLAGAYAAIGAGEAAS